jgi:hypothetical protein
MTIDDVLVYIFKEEKKLMSKCTLKPISCVLVKTKKDKIKPY